MTNLSMEDDLQVVTMLNVSVIPLNAVISFCNEKNVTVLTGKIFCVMS